MSKKLPKVQIQSEAADVRLTPQEKLIFGIASSQPKKDTHKHYPYVALKYFDNEWQCFSDWEKDELQQFSSFLKKLAGYTWQQVYETAGKPGTKHGLAYTKLDINSISDSAKEHLSRVRQQISDDIQFFELRVNQNKLRVHGFQSQSAFFLILLDREHQVCPV
ncbi:MAG: hypothetical protein PHF31_05760 [Methylobacter sp.]|nr:hypothetical protein [Methylobacter sp.]